MIMYLTYGHGEIISGEFRVHKPVFSISRNRDKYVSMVLEDNTGSLRAYWGSGRCPSPGVLKEQDKVRVVGQLRTADNGWIAEIMELEKLGAVSADPFRLVPLRLCPAPDLLDAIRELIDSFTIEPLRHFVEQVMNDDEIVFPFVSLPASRNHHHNYGGGLFTHSFDCANIVASLPEFSVEERELGTVAALFHDVAKIRTLQRVKGWNPEGFLLSHDVLTLEMLSPHLKQLDRAWRDGGLALRYLLTWHFIRQREPVPKMIMAEAVAFADRISCGRDRGLTAFNGIPQWKSCASLGGSYVWRPRLM